MDKQLARSIIKHGQLTKRDLHEVAQHGCVNAAPRGFTFFSETVEFYKLHQTEIVAAMDEAAADAGTDTLSFVKTICEEDASWKDVALTLWSNDHTTSVANTLVWFVVELVAEFYINR